MDSICVPHRITNIGSEKDFWRCFTWEMQELELCSLASDRILDKIRGNDDQIWEVSSGREWQIQQFVKFKVLAMV